MTEKSKKIENFGNLGKIEKWVVFKFCHLGGTLFLCQLDKGSYCEKNDREMTGVLCGGVQGFWV